MILVISQQAKQTLFFVDYFMALISCEYENYNLYGMCSVNAFLLEKIPFSSIQPTNPSILLLSPP